MAKTIKNTIKKPSLRKALRELDNKPDEDFGNIDIDVTTLPSLNRQKKKKITVDLDEDLLDEYKKTAKKLGIPYSSLINDVLRKVTLKNVKKVA